ncbi:MAG: hypothetical protein RIQ88_35 [Actinomycetota bacterium]|jgi:uncharacterized membrane protein YeaQ/YmgE (transglycosylase-associated protein family)
MEIVFILIYGALLGLMAPYLLSGKEYFGNLLAPAIAWGFGFLAWIILTWVGLSYNDYWIWSVTMLGMPVAMILGVRFIRAKRMAEEKK